MAEATWKGKVAIVTGASAGIGAAVCKDLCKQNITVVGLARRWVRLNKLKEEIACGCSGARFHPIKCDLTQEDDIKRAFDEVKDRFGGVDILINNAGVGGNMAILEDGSEELITRIIQTNILAVVNCTKRAYKSMVDRNVPGYIINVSSILGYNVPFMGLEKPILNVYPSTKYALTALNHVLRSELNFFKQNKIRVSNISPGFVETEYLMAAGIATEYPAGLPVLKPEDVADAISYMLNTPSRVQIQDIIIKPTGEMV